MFSLAQLCHAEIKHPYRDESYSDDSPYGECSLISRKKHSLLHYNLPLFAPFNKKYIFIRNKKSSNIGESQKFG